MNNGCCTDKENGIVYPLSQAATMKNCVYEKIGNIAKY